MLKLNHRNKGFTLVELLVVLAILTLLAGLVGPQVLKQLDRSKSKTAALQILDLEQALELYKLDVGRFPSTEQGLEALVQQPSGAFGWNGSYLKGSKIPQDPWGESYYYRYPGQLGTLDVYTYGLDGSPGGEGENADITNQY